MGSIALPDRLPRATSLGIMGGITNMTTQNRLTRLTRLSSTARRRILGKLVKMVKW